MVSSIWPVTAGSIAVWFGVARFTTCLVVIGVTMVSHIDYKLWAKNSMVEENRQELLEKRNNFNILYVKSIELLIMNLAFNKHTWLHWLEICFFIWMGYWNTNLTWFIHFTATTINCGFIFSKTGGKQQTTKILI